jgi:hypothetical protein
MVLPQPRHTRSGFGIGIVGAAESILASRLCCCVSRVGIELRLLARDVVVQSMWATYSAHGATSFLQVGAVSDIVFVCGKCVVVSGSQTDPQVSGGWLPLIRHGRVGLVGTSQMSPHKHLVCGQRKPQCSDHAVSTVCRGRQR